MCGCYIIPHILKQQASQIICLKVWMAKLRNAKVHQQPLDVWHLRSVFCPDFNFFRGIVSVRFIIPEKVISPFGAPVPQNYREGVAE